MNIEELQKRLETVEAENVILKAQAGMNDQEKAYYATLSDADKSAFAGMDAAGRKAKMGDKLKKSLVGDEVEAIEKCATDAEKAAAEAKTEITKRDETIAKRDEEIAKLKGEKEDAELRAEVEKKYPHSKGTVEEKMAVLKSIKAMPDESVRKNLLTSLDQAETSLAELAKEKGASGGEGGGAGPKEALDAMAKSIAEKEKITFQQGFSKALETPEGKKLYNELNK